MMRYKPDGKAVVLTDGERRRTVADFDVASTFAEDLLYGQAQAWAEALNLLMEIRDALITAQPEIGTTKGAG